MKTLFKKMAIVVSESKNSAYLLYQIEKQAFYLET